MLWCCHLLPFIFLFDIKYFAFALKKLYGSKLISDLDRFKRELKVNSNQTVISYADENLPTETVNFVNSTETVISNSAHNVPSWLIPIKSGALQRTGYVVLGFVIIVLLFFVIRSIKMHRKGSKSRKYGVISSTDLEMTPLDYNDQDEEEEVTLFDVKHKFLK